MAHHISHALTCYTHSPRSRTDDPNKAMTPRPSIPQAEASTVPKQGAVRGRLLRLVKRLRIGVAWQWRKTVLVAEIKDYGAALMEVGQMLLQAVLGLISAPIGLFLLVWSFTGGMIFAAMRAEDDLMDKLEAKLRRKNPPNA